MKSKGLGRGLKALIPTTPEGAAEDAEIVELPLERITPSRYQARQDFDEDSIRELASSIKEHGVMMSWMALRAVSWPPKRAPATVIPPPTTLSRAFSLRSTLVLSQKAFSCPETVPK